MSRAGIGWGAAICLCCAACADPLRPVSGWGTASNSAPAPTASSEPIEFARTTDPAADTSNPPATAETSTRPARVASVSLRAEGGPVSTAAPVGERPANSVGSGILFVNGETLTLEQVLEPILEDLKQRAVTMPAERYIEHVRDLVSSQIWQNVSEILVYQDARRALDERYNEALDREVDRVLQERVNNEFGGRQARFEKHLADLGLSLKEVRERTARRLLVGDYLRRKLTGGAPEPRRDELWDYYDKHREEYRSPARAELRLIDIPFDAFVEGGRAGRDTPDWMRSRDQAQRQIHLALGELDAGRSFAEVASRYSRGVRADKGGDWGFIGPDSLAGRYRIAGTVLFSLSPGAHSRVIEGEDGYFIVGAGRIEREHVLTFEEAQPRIREALRNRWFEEREREYLAQLRAKAHFRRWDEFTGEVIRALPRPRNADPHSPRSAAVR